MRSTRLFRFCVAIAMVAISIWGFQGRVMGTTTSPTLTAMPICGTPHFHEWTVWAAQNLSRRPLTSDELQARGKMDAQGNILADTVGQQRTFWAYNFASGTDYKLTATCKKVGVHSYIYLEDGKDVSDAVLTDIVNEFDDNIYPTDTSIFGNEPNPGIDMDSHIYILLLDIQDGWTGSSQEPYVAGYFDPVNEYPASEDSHSNEKEMFYMDIYPGTPGSKEFYGTLAHEFQHMIHWNNDHEERRWVNEGCSELARFVCGYGHSPNLPSFLEFPDKRLNEFKNRLKDYGSTYLWTLYFWEKYGGNSTIKNLVADSDKGIAGINSVLASLGYSDRFKDAFNNWTVANYLDDTTIEAGKYGYDNLDLVDSGADNANSFPRSALSGSYSAYPANGSDDVNHWAADYYKFTGAASPLILNFDGDDDGSFKVNLILSTSSNFSSGSNTVQQVELNEDQGGSIAISDFGMTYKAALLVPSPQSDGSPHLPPLPYSYLAFSPAAIYVPDDYPAIQEAVDAANPGDRIIVRSGTYTETIDVNKDYLTIKSENGAEETIVQAENSDDHVFGVTADYVIINGFTIKGASGEKKAGIYLNDVSNCGILDNICTDNYGGIGLDSSNDCNIKGNTCNLNQKAGIGLSKSRGNSIINNTCSNNEYGIGITEEEICAIEQSVYQSNVANSESILNSIRRFRDKALKTEYVRLYYEYSPDVRDILIEEPSLSIELSRLIVKYIPTVRYLIEDKIGRDLKINARDVEQALSFVEKLKSEVKEREERIGKERSSEMKRLLEEFEEEVKASKGKKISQAFRNSVYFAGETEARGQVHKSNGDRGMKSGSTFSNNIIYLNNFVDNDNNVKTSYSTNTWHSPGPITYIYKDNIYTSRLGNFWDDYTGSDTDGDGIGETPYSINSDNKDKYPLVEPFENYITWGMLRDKAVKLIKQVTGAPYLWGGKGYDPSAALKKFFKGQVIKEEGYNYWNPEKKKIDFGKGLDCSGLNFWAYNRARFGEKELTWEKFRSRPLYWHSANMQYRGNIDEISKEKLRPGDLLFFDEHPIGDEVMNHVAMYIGPFSYEGAEYNAIHASGFAGKIVPAYYNFSDETFVTRVDNGGQTLTVDGYGRVKEAEIPKFKAISGSPVDLIVTDPEGEIITKEIGESPAMEYITCDIDGDGELDDIVASPERKIGNYSIQVVPELDALPTDTYSLEATVDGETTVLAEDVPISDIPNQPYVVKSKAFIYLPIVMKGYGP